MIKFTIGITPVSKKNSQRILRYGGIYGKPFIAPSTKYQEYEKASMPFCPKSGIDYPVNIKAIFHMPTRRRVDLTNLLEALDDVLRIHGTIKDDSAQSPSIVVSHDGSRVIYDKNNGKTEVEISKSEEVSDKFFQKTEQKV